MNIVEYRCSDVFWGEDVFHFTDYVHVQCRCMRIMRIIQQLTNTKLLRH